MLGTGGRCACPQPAIAGNPLTEKDANGNTVRSYTWQHGRQLASMYTNGDTLDDTTDDSTWTYTYNADGLRTSRTNGTTTYEYIYNGSQLSQMNVGSSSLYFTYDASSRPVSVQYDTDTSDAVAGDMYYYVTNIQGDVIAIENSNQIVVASYGYDAWGVNLDVIGSLADGLGELNPLRYRGYVWDSEIGLYYLQSRYYDPEVGRFVNADRYTTTGQGFFGNNMFCYCCNNPTMFIDPCGEMLAFDFLKDAIMGDSEDRKYDGKSKFSRALKKSAGLMEEFEANLDDFISSGVSLYAVYHGTFSTYSGETLNDKDLSLTVGAANYSMLITKETRTTGILWWEKEETRYVAEVSVWDTYDFTEWRDDSSLGSVLNNIAYIGQLVGLIVPYNWEADVVITTEWE